MRIYFFVIYRYINYKYLYILYYKYNNLNLNLIKLNNGSDMYK